MTIATTVPKLVYLEPSEIQALEEIVRNKGGRKKGYSFSSELGVALREHLRRHKAGSEEATMTPVWQKLLDEKFEQLETWLRPGVWGGATYGTTAALLLLELLCGMTIDPKDAKDHFELVRGRAWKMVRRDPTGAAAKSGTEGS